MIADTLDELHAMAQSLGLKRQWFQVSRSGMPHYDICQSKREHAISLGAVAIDRRKLVELVKAHRERQWHEFQAPHPQIKVREKD
jgi:hypothetical protein